MSDKTREQMDLSKLKELASKATPIALAALLAACGHAGREEPITMVVQEVFEDKAPMGCVGTDWNTLLRSEDGRVAKMCGRWGKPGDKVSGCWVTGGDEGWPSGFIRVCSGHSAAQVGQGGETT